MSCLSCSLYLHGAGQESGPEAVIHAMHGIFKDDGTESILLIDAKNAFNAMNHEVMLKNIPVLCPIISTFIQNCSVYLHIYMLLEVLKYYQKKGQHPSSSSTYPVHQ